MAKFGCGTPVTGETLFLTALAKTGRTGLTEYLKTQNVANEDAKRQATASYHTLPLLLDPALRSYTLSAFASARGRRIEASHLFPVSLWLGGVRDVEDGRNFLGSFGAFVRLLEERAQKLAPKSEGWVVEPTTNTNGHRTNASTKAMHALFLDVDGRGEWHPLLNALVSHGFAFIAYQSGGWSPTTPKWRVILPLTKSFDTSTEEKQAAWKQIYHRVRTVVGAVAQLNGEGFDPATDTPCCPWFLTEKRNAKDPERKIVWCTGHSFDLMSLVLALPPLEETIISHATPREIHELSLTDDKRDAIITSLSRATASIPSGRHELYLALPGVLLDRGISPDEVLEIIEAVSQNYPRSHPKHHADNMHNARTTVGRWKSGATVTRIGTLNERWPDIAQAIDRVLPDTLTSSLLLNTEMFITQQSASSTVAGAPLPSLPPKRRRKLSPLAKELVPLVKQMEKSPNAMRRSGAILIRRIIDGDSFQSENSTVEQVDALVCAATKALGFALPSNTWIEVLALAQETLLSMYFTQSVERVAKAEAAFLVGQKQRRKWNNKQNMKVQQELAEAKNLLAEAEAIASRGTR